MPLVTAAPAIAVTADTSVVVPSLAAWHEQHDRALEAVAAVRALPAHVLFETMSVLSRLPHGVAQPLSVTADLLDEAFPDGPLVLPGDAVRSLLRRLGETGVSGGAVYDGLVAATARHHDASLLSLDARARPVYTALGADVRWLLERG